MFDILFEINQMSDYLAAELKETKEELITLQQTYDACEAEYRRLDSEHQDLLKKYNNLIEEIKLTD